LPLVPSDSIPNRSNSVKDFGAVVYDKKLIYVASGASHKNHLRLLDAWEVLAREGLYPTLLLTLDNDKDLVLLSYINEMKLRLPVKIDNLGVLSHQHVLEVYTTVDALIFPSLTESFGLPLIEANKANIPIIASELDFVRDLVVPAQSFDPSSITSIARAIKRYLGVNNSESFLLGPEEFLEKIVAISEH
jgi:glycosyltransferase involved in cell wall biosynthesis